MLTVNYQVLAVARPGTRITVELILEKLAAGETIEHLLDAHPHMTRRAIQEALAFAARALKADVV